MQYILLQTYLFGTLLITLYMFYSFRLPVPNPTFETKAVRSSPCAISETLASMISVPQLSDCATYIE